MATSLYISDENLVAVCGKDNGNKLSISCAYRMELPGGVISNGQILDPNSLAKCISALFSKSGLSKDVRLVMNSAYGLSQIMDVPTISPAKLRSLIANEFSIQNANSSVSDRIYDYSVIRAASKNSPNRILGCAFEKALIGQYIRVFSDAHINLDSINASVSCAAELSKRITNRSDKTFAISLINGHDMISFLYTNGIYSVSLRNKLFETRGTQSLAVEISRNLSSMIQFNTAQTGSAPISKIFLSGMRDDESNYCGDIAAFLETDIGLLFDSIAIKFPQDCQAITQHGDFLYCCGDLIQG